MINSPNSSAKPNNRYQAQKPIAIVNLDIGQTISIYPNDNIREVVDNFCIANDLTEECADYLYKNISMQIGGKAKENVYGHPPSFGVKNDYLTESFGNPIQRYPQTDTASNQTNASNHTTNQSLSEKNDGMLASNYEKWHQLINENSKSKPLLKPIPNNTGNFVSHLKSTPNIFNKLYEEGLQQYKIREEVRQLNLQHKQETELRQATFKPNISSKSKLLAQQSRGRLEAQPRKSPQQPQNYTYRPEISPNTRKLMQHREKSRSGTPIHHKLYTEGLETDRLKQQWAKEQFDKDHPFRLPSQTKLNVNQREQQEAIKRLLTEKDKKQDRSLNSIQQIQKEDQYKPPSYPQEKQLKSTSSNAALSQVQQIQSGYVSPRQGHTRNTSTSGINMQDLDQAAKKVFGLLDDDKDGIISATNVDLSQLDGSMLEIIKDVLYMLEDDGLEYSWVSFRDMCIQKNVAELLIREASLPKPSSRSFKTLF